MCLVNFYLIVFLADSISAYSLLADLKKTIKNREITHKQKFKCKIWKKPTKWKLESFKKMKVNDLACMNTNSGGYCYF